MKVAVISLVLLGLLAAVCAAVLMGTLAGRSDSAHAPAAAKVDQYVEVLLAARDLPPMSIIDKTLVTTKKVPASQVPENALLNPVQVVGKVITSRMVAHQAFTKGCFPREGQGIALATALPPGKRAVSITLSDWSGMAGLLYPGSTVDVLVSFKQLGGGHMPGDEMMATTLLQGLQVLAIGSQSIAQDEFRDKNPGALAGNGQINTRMVTLLVDTKQAEVLQLAMQSGSVSLAMRNPLDGSHESRRLTRAREIAPDGAFGVSMAAAPDPFTDKPAVAEPAPAAPANEWETIIIRGTNTQSRRFPLPTADHPSLDMVAPAATPKAQLEPAGADAGDKDRV
jgi:pilus assembly protein CpaB